MFATAFQALETANSHPEPGVTFIICSRTTKAKGKEISGRSQINPTMIEIDFRPRLPYNKHLIDSLGVNWKIATAIVIIFDLTGKALPVGEDGKPIRMIQKLFAREDIKQSIFHNQIKYLDLAHGLKSEI